MAQSLTTKYELESHHYSYLAARGIEDPYEKFTSATRVEAERELGYDPGSDGFWISDDCLVNSSRQFHPDEPLLDKNGKPAKWLTGKGFAYGDGFSVVEPDGPVAIGNTAVITEGITKAEVFCQYGIPAISLFGVSAWSIPKITPRRIKPELLRYLPKNIVLAFDMDLWHNATVQNELLLLGQALEKAGKLVKFADWDRRYKGIDDCLANDPWPRDTALEIIDRAKPIGLIHLSVAEAIEEEAEATDGIKIETETLGESFDQAMRTADNGLSIPEQEDWSKPYAWRYEPRAKGFEQINLLEYYRGEIVDFTDRAYQVVYDKKKGTVKKTFRDSKSAIELNQIIRNRLLNNRLVNTSTKKLDEDPNKIRFNNGVYDLRKDSLDTSNYSYISKSVGYPLLQGDTPVFDKWVADSFGDVTKEYILATLRFLVDVTEKIPTVVHIMGESGSGKGVFCSLVAALMGHHIAAGDLDEVTQPDKILQQLGHCRIHMNTDVTHVIRDPSLLYKVSAHEPLPYRELYSSYAETRSVPRRVLLASINPLTIINKDGATGGWERRVLALHTRKGEGFREDHSLMDKLRAELPAIMHQILSMPFDTAKELLKVLDKVTPVEDKVGEDYLNTFIKEHFIPTQDSNASAEVAFNARPHPPGEEFTPYPDDLVRMGVVYQWYQRWCVAMGTHPRKRSTLQNRLRKIGGTYNASTKRIDGLRYVDVGLSRIADDYDVRSYNPHRFIN